MTKWEIARFLGYNNTTKINMAFVAASKECKSIRDKMSKSTKVMVVDYTPEEVVCAMKYFTLSTYTPMVECLLLENFIYRKKPYLLKTKDIKIPNDARSMLYTLWVLKSPPFVCDTCTYLEARTPNRIGAKPRPYCTFHSVYLHKIKPKVNIYKDRCSSQKFFKGEYFIFTDAGVFRSKQCDLKRGIIKKQTKTDFIGIPQNSFYSKRESEEPILILKDIFEDESETSTRKLRIPSE